MKYLLSLLIAICAFAATAQSVPYLQFVERADSAIAADDWAAAERLMQSAIDLEPDNPTNLLLMSNLGIARFNLGQDSLAIATLDAAIAIAPASVTVLSNRAKVHMAIGNIAQAYRDFGRIMELDSTLVDPIYYHGMIALSVGDAEQAAIDFDRLAELDPDSPNTRLALASFYSAIDEPVEAIKQYSWLIENDPQPLYYAARAELYLADERLDEASADIAEALRLDPEDPDLYLTRAILNKMRYRAKEAAADVRAAIALGADPARVKALGLSVK